MSKTAAKPIYDPAKTFDDNFDNGPFGYFANTKPYRNKGEPKYFFLGFPVYEPFGIPAGSLPNSRFIHGAFNAGFDVVCYKTQRSIQFPVNEYPNIIAIDIEGQVTLEQAEKGLIKADSFGADPTKYTITNSFGNPSRGPEFWVDDLKKAIGYEGRGQILIMSVVGTIKEGFSQSDYYDDFAKTAELAAGTGVKAIEINLSCPNVANEGVVCYTHEAVVEIVKRSKKKIGNTPLIIKIGYYTNDQQPLLEKIIKDVAPYISAISAINTIPAVIRNQDGSQALPGEGRLKSGLCGAGIKWAGLEMVKRLDSLRNKKGYDYEIIGVGGVMTAKDYYEYRRAGADCVQSATGSIWNPLLAQQIKENIK